MIQEFQDKKIRFETRSDGRIWGSLTDIAKATGKRVNNYLYLTKTLDLIEKTAVKYQLDSKEVIITKKGGNFAQGTWALEEIVLDFQKWCLNDKKKQTEKSVQNRLYEELGGDREVQVLAGSIDLLTCTEIIEIKNARDWKSGVGQLMVYGYDYLSHSKRLHIFGKTSGSYQRMVEKYCYPLRIKVTYED